MKTTHTFEKSFGPAASFTGTVIFVAGLLATFYSLTALVLIVIGAFLAFTNTSTTIDDEKKMIRFSNNMFGFIKTGKWISLNKDMKLGVKQEKTLYRTYSRSNQTMDIKTQHKKIYLFDENNKPIVPLRMLRSAENKDVIINQLCEKLGIQRLAGTKQNNS